ncbi:hypothetical protein [Flavobacterium covae]|uniref:hypothetical protein n=1 Tax=Flavobacterium covae TaxID=2906076 RepID=UPI0035E3FBE7
MAVVGVECNADRYFFGRLLENKNLIRKERNDTEVISGVVVRSRGNFSIGIIDVDKDKKLPSEFTKISEGITTQIFKHNSNCQFLILVGPRQFEHWINEYLKGKEVSVENFGFTIFNDFMETSKSIKPEANEKFKNVIDYIFSTYKDEENHILKLKRQLEYILEKKYQFNIEEFLEI